ncbi:MAG: hypothetical protein WDW38_010930 [Sanguina aurantia]
MVSSAVPVMASNSSAQEQIPVPLCLRPADREESFSALLQWQNHFREQLRVIGNTWEEQDDGPSGEQLQQELVWVLDDTVQAVQRTPTSPWVGVERWATLTSEAAAELRSGGRKTSDAWRVRVRATAAELHTLWERRIRLRTPYQYLINSSPWGKHVLAVGPGVLIPRPETEMFFPDFVAGAVRANPGLAQGPWLDLGTGSGAIAIAAAGLLCKKNKDAHVVAVDLSPIALAFAAHNTRLCGLERHISTAQGSWYQALRSPTPTEPNTLPPSQHTDHSSSSSSSSSNGHECPAVEPRGQAHSHPTQSQQAQTLPADAVRDGSASMGPGEVRKFAGILSNPPYIPSDQMQTLQPEVGRHEPWSALDGGVGSGMTCLDPICRGAAEFLLPGGVLALETAGGDQAHEVAKLLRSLTSSSSSSSSSSPQTNTSSSSSLNAVQFAQGTGPEGALHTRAPVFENVCVVKDCYDVDRFVTARRSAF